MFDDKNKDGKEEFGKCGGTPQNNRHRRNTPAPAAGKVCEIIRKQLIIKNTMKKFVLIVFLLLTVNCFSQTGNWLWGRQISPTGSVGSISNGLASDILGNVYATGSFTGSATFGSITLNAAYFDFFIVKYSPTGQAIWAKSMGQAVPYSVATDASGNVYVTGNFNDTIVFDTITLVNPTGGMFLVKYSPSGIFLWAKSGGVNGSVNATSIVTDGLDNVYITGTFYAPNVVFGADTLINNGISSMFLVKYSPSGTVLWAKCEGGGSDAYGNSVATDASGNVIVAGCYDTSIVIGSNTFISSGANDMFVAKYASTGTLLWARSAGGSDWDTGSSIATDVNGNIYMVGSFRSPTFIFGSDTLTNAGYGDMFIVKYSPIGSELFGKRAGGVGDEWLASISTDLSGIFVKGTFGSSSVIFDTDTLSYTSGVNFPIYVVKYDFSLNVICATSLTSGGGNTSVIAADGLGRAYMAGEFLVDPFIIGSDTLTITECSNLFIAKYNCDGLSNDGINELLNQENISIYPNPTSTSITIAFNKVCGNLFIYDLLGQMVYNSKLNSSTASIDLSSFAKGIYFVEVQNDGGILRKKFIKE